jgi:hypothetical protein
VKTIVKYRFEQIAVLVKVLAVPLVTLLLAGCGAAGNLSGGAVYVENSETSIVVFGVQPQMRVQAFPVTKGSRGWNQSKWQSAAINAVPKNGYIVAEVAPTQSGEAYAVIRIVPSLLDIWHVCSDGSVVTFSIPPRSIVYVGDITIIKEGKYRLEIGHDYAKARQFMRQNFPAMASRLTDGNAIWGKMEDGEC